MQSLNCSYVPMHICCTFGIISLCLTQFICLSIGLIPVTWWLEDLDTLAIEHMSHKYCGCKHPTELYLWLYLSFLHLIQKVKPKQIWMQKSIEESVNKGKILKIDKEISNMYAACHNTLLDIRIDWFLH